MSFYKCCIILYNSHLLLVLFNVLEAFSSSSLSFFQLSINGVLWVSLKYNNDKARFSSLKNLFSFVRFSSLFLSLFILSFKFEFVSWSLLFLSDLTISLDLFVLNSSQFLMTFEPLWVSLIVFTLWASLNCPLLSVLCGSVLLF